MQSSTDNSNRLRTVRSFVRRAGRITAAQKRALRTLLPLYGIEYSSQKLDLDEIFGREARRIMEIGFGDGGLLVSMAAENSDTDFIGVEVYEPGVGHCLLSIRNRGLSNVRVICHDAIEVLQNQIPDSSLHGVHLFFPDPWPKKRHHKRRIVQPSFVELLHRKIRPAGYLHTATDHDEYAEHMHATVVANKGFRAKSKLPGKRPGTKFERRGQRLGHRITEGFFVRI
jgi:tRNA (guanine-N7-)-methyltransferase